MAGDSSRMDPVNPPKPPTDPAQAPLMLPAGPVGGGDAEEENAVSRVKFMIQFSKVGMDAALTAFAFVVAYYMRRTIPFPAESTLSSSFLIFVPMGIVQVVSVLMVFYINRLYHTTRNISRVDELTQVFGALSIGTMMAVAISTLTFRNTVFDLEFPRGMILYAWMVGILFVMVGRAFHRRFWHRMRMRGLGRERVLVVGSGDVAQAVIQKIQWTPYLGYDVVGVVNGNTVTEVSGTPVIGPINALPDLIDQYKIQEVIIALPEGTSRREVVRIVGLCQRGQVSIKIFPDLFEFITTGVSIDDLGGLPMLNVRDIQLRGWRLSLKRGLDVLGAAAGLVMLSPILMTVAAIIRIQSPGPVFYCQERMGLDGKPFQMVKFRSMRTDAEAAGPGWTQKDDPRITGIGAWMRAHNVDELPQLINVLLGEMSLVGPRPERPVYVQKFRQSIPRYMERHREKAGMTGWAQVNGLRGDTSIAERTKYDLWYIENWSLWLDIRIILRTVLQTFLGSSNAY